MGTPLINFLIMGFKVMCGKDNKNIAHNQHFSKKVV